MLLIFLVAQAMAGIFGEDSRFEAYQASNAQQFKLARATPALIRSEAIEQLVNGDYLSKPRSGVEMRICPDAAFANQPFLVNCSASLIAEDLILTAAHCIDITGPSVCGNFKIVFDFAMGEEYQTFKASQIYECKKLEYYQFNPRDMKEDIAIIRLDRKVQDREFIELDMRSLKIGEKLEMMGYPLGLPLKGVDAGKITSLDPEKMSFRHDLDTFSCNSGGPVFSKDGKQIGVLVRGTTANLKMREGANCYDWGIAKPTDYAEANHLSHLDSVLQSLLNAESLSPL